MPREQQDARGRCQSSDGFGRHHISAQEIDLAVAVGRGRIAHAGGSRLKAMLQVLRVGRHAVVQDHQVHGEALGAPVAEGLDQFTRHGNVVGGIDAQQHDRPITRYALRP
jgi:hypothetical protein